MTLSESKRNLKREVEKNFKHYESFLKTNYFLIDSKPCLPKSLSDMLATGLLYVLLVSLN
jgi:hypothetical protein